MNMDAPAVGAPEGEIVQGENMDIADENEKVKKGQDLDEEEEEEPEVSGAVQ